MNDERFKPCTCPVKSKSSSMSLYSIKSCWDLLSTPVHLLVHFYILMVPKRVLNEWDSDETESSKRKLSLTWSDLIGRDVTFGEFQSYFEPVIRKTVREVVDKLLHSSSPSQSHDETKTDWMLRFVNQPPPKVFTGNKVEDRDSAQLRVEVVDVNTKTVVSAGPISSLKLEIVVLPGDFDAYQQNDWGYKYFDSHVVYAREDKKPLIIGEVRTSLKNGVGLISSFCFTDNSRWTKSAKFRLGVRVQQGSSKGYRVREAVSDAFKVKDRRGEACMKHSCPSLTDEVWRLKMIRRNGKYHERLESIGIKTVGDFLQKLRANPSTIKETLKCGSSNRTWNTIVQHALSHKKEQYDAPIVSPKVDSSVNQDIAAGMPITNPHGYQLQQVADDLEGYTSNGTYQVPVDVAPTYTSGDCLDIQDIIPDQQGHEFSPFMPSTSNYHGMDDHMETSFPNTSLADVHQSLCTRMTDEEFPQWFMNDSYEMMVQTESANSYPCSPLLWRQLSANFSAAINESDIGLFSSLVPYNATPRTAWCKLRAAVIWRVLIRQMQVTKAKKA